MRVYYEFTYILNHVKYFNKSTNAEVLRRIFFEYKLKEGSVKLHRMRAILQNLAIHIKKKYPKIDSLTTKTFYGNL